MKEDPKKITDPVHFLDPMDTSSSVYKAMNEYQRFSYESAYNEVNYHLSNRAITWSHVYGKVLDFGCQQGAGSYVFASHGAEVTIVDRAFSFEVDNIARLGYLDPKRIIKGDGIELMNKRMAPGSLDMITSWMMLLLSDSGVSESTLTDRFLKAAARVLKPDGRILMTSDDHTTAKFMARVGPEWKIEFSDKYGAVLSKASAESIDLNSGGFLEKLRRFVR